MMNPIHTDNDSDYDENSGLIANYTGELSDADNRIKVEESCLHFCNRKINKKLGWSGVIFVALGCISLIACILSLLIGLNIIPTPLKKNEYELLGIIACSATLVFFIICLSIVLEKISPQRKRKCNPPRRCSKFC